MSAVIVSDDYSITIPDDVRQQLEIEPGMEFDVLVKGGHLHLVPRRSLREMYGFLKGMDTTLERDSDRL